jgi:hypothetical protein
MYNMRRLYYIGSFLSVICLVLACKKTEVKPVPHTALQEIATPSFAGDYFIEDVATSEFKIPVGTTTVSDQPRTITFTFTSTGAVSGVQYTAPASVTIPAGKANDTLRIKGFFSAYPPGRKDILKIKITGGSLPNFPGKDSFMLTLQRFCPVDLVALAGDYDNTFEGSYGPYTSSVINLVPDPPSDPTSPVTSATGTITNIYDSGIDAVAKFDWSSKASFKVTISPQQTQYSSGGLPLFIRTTPNTTSTFSSCENTITLKLDLYTTAGIYDSWTSSMAK